ncbi:MAG: tRNA 4-thiouridine(8) synthase ThiI [Thermodesulfobacteriota bacterium]
MKALAVFSGGLDSMLAAELVRAQDIEVLGLFFETPFFTSLRPLKSAAAIHLPLKVIDITGIHLEMVKNPRHGYGSRMNPCIDCHALMLAEAGKRLEQEGARFLITGEVLGQRPMSQNRGALTVVARESGFEGLILRPLSARLLPATVPEQSGWVKREELMAFSGRSRKPQMRLAEVFGIRDYPSPAGGCLLTDVTFSRRLKDLLSSQSTLEVRELELLKVGRHFRTGPGTKVVVGRNQEENEAICMLAKEGDLLLRTVTVPGPTVLVMGDVTPDWEEWLASLTVSYSDARGDESTGVRLSGKGNERILCARPRPKSEFKGYMIE